VTVVFALLSALSNAAAAVTQRLANVTAPHHGVGFIRQTWYLVRRPIWIVGTVCLLATFGFGLLALYGGQQAVVQPIYATELIFVLVIRQLWLHDRISVSTWGAATLLLIGLVGFLLIARPMPGAHQADAARWAFVLGTRALLVGALLVLGRHGSPRRRAALIGAAAAIVWSVDTSFVKATTVSLQKYGWAGVFTHWPVYALVACGVLGEILVQITLHVGPLSASQPALLIVEPLFGIVAGIQLFGEQITTGALAITGEVLTLALMAAGVLLVTRWSPPDLAPDVLAERRATAAG
jgi:hypothetical protein